MKFKRAIFTHNFFSFLLALYLLNYSIDGKDGHPDYIAEDLSHNDIESILEFALESVLGIENAMEEHDERDHNDVDFLRHHVIYCQQLLSIPIVFDDEEMAEEHQFKKPSLWVPQSYLDIISPPPKV